MMDLKQVDSVINCNVQSFVYDIGHFFVFNARNIQPEVYFDSTRPSIVILLLP